MREAEEGDAPHSKNAVEDTQCEVELIGLDPLCQYAESSIEQINIQAGMPVTKFPNRCRKNMSRNPWSCPNGDAPVLPLGSLFNARHPLVQRVERRSGDLQKFTALSGQYHVACRAIEQPKSNLTLQLAHQHTQARRSKIQRLSSPREVAMLRNEVKRSKLS